MAIAVAILFPKHKHHAHHRLFRGALAVAAQGVEVLQGGRFSNQQARVS
jgi:hypothetical protein